MDRLRRFYKAEICVLHIEARNKGPVKSCQATERIVLLSDGIHYDSVILKGFGADEVRHVAVLDIRARELAVHPGKRRHTNDGTVRHRERKCPHQWHESMLLHTDVDLALAFMACFAFGRLDAQHNFSRLAAHSHPKDRTQSVPFLNALMGKHDLRNPRRQRFAPSLNQELGATARAMRPFSRFS